ncbi:hypothetical protein FNH05_09015 [Amycolatopsis rhizosphaerae]|uniref:Uncharacterized protein n=1 Tax=Amycolatopsis rhizosphaerae TaxID=2053003 RepID=A0A558D4A8_9PSEU|nr:hypothetical protein [Amycolatopsis rhizosphaerae]TVT55848.1 hypothetical protein FNH05_09015 [Amycolatopsis rhizosphaerae]
MHVILATIPPLGLGSSDPREAVRVAINQDIRSNYSQYGAGEVLDHAVADNTGGHPNQINPSYLTSNQPNAAYYQQLAQTLADAINTFPPAVTL